MENHPWLFHVASQIGWTGISRERQIKCDLVHADLVDFGGLRLATDLLPMSGLWPLATTLPVHAASNVEVVSSTAKLQSFNYSISHLRIAHIQYVIISIAYFTQTLLDLYETL